MGTLSQSGTSERRGRSDSGRTYFSGKEVNGMPVERTLGSMDYGRLDGGTSQKDSEDSGWGRGVEEEGGQRTDNEERNVVQMDIKRARWVSIYSHMIQSCLRLSVTPYDAPSCKKILSRGTRSLILSLFFIN